MVPQVADRGAGQPEHRRDRQVDLTGHDHEQHRQRHDRDVAGVDEGSASPFYRMILTAYEYPTDEVICSWTDAGIPDFYQMNWGSSNLPLTGFYSRLMYDVTLCNHFMERTAELTDEKTVRQRAEVRFLRALNYYYLMDAYGNPPFTETVSLNEAPQQIKRADLFDYLENELKEIEADLVDPRTGQFGQVDKGLAGDAAPARVYRGSTDGACGQRVGEGHDAGGDAAPRVHVP